MASNLIAPRFEVFWGKTNLMLYSLEGSQEPQPLVTKASVNLVSTGSTPTGSLQWNPSGPAVEAYQKFVEKDITSQITIRFFYPNGKSIGFVFVWSGQSISYGTDMGIEVKLRSELDGVINAGLRSFAQANEKDSAAPMTSAISKLEKQFGVDDLKLIQYTEQATQDLTKAKVENAYASNIVFTSALTNMVESNGNTVFASNIDKAGLTVFTPYSWEKSPTVANAADLTEQTSPDPSKRYGYILGPAIIDTIQRSTEWQPPQQTNVNKPTSTPIPKGKKKESNQNPESTPNTKAQEVEAKPSAAPTNSSNRISPNMKLKDNEDGPKKQEMLNKEKQSKLTANLFMCPVVTGIKPYDIIFIPSLTGTYMEDWVVESVGYEQDGGKISLNIQATRPYGLGNAMQPKVAQEFLSFAKGSGLLGPSATLEAWTNYAWPASLR